MANEELEQQELEAQMQAATDAIRAAILQLLREGEVHPQVIVLAVARVAGELGARPRRWRVNKMSRSCWASWPMSCSRPGGSSGRCYGPRCYR